MRHYLHIGLLILSVVLICGGFRGDDLERCPKGAKELIKKARRFVFDVEKLYPLRLFSEGMSFGGYIEHFYGGYNAKIELSTVAAEKMLIAIIREYCAYIDADKTFRPFLDNLVCDERNFYLSIYYIDKETKVPCNIRCLRGQVEYSEYNPKSTFYKSCKREPFEKLVERLKKEKIID